MAGRFNQSAGNAYTSQFVPKQLPLALMAQSLQAKQSKYNQVESDIAEKRAAFTQTAYGTTHEAKLEEKTAKFDQFVEDSYAKDLTSPDFIREYRQFTADWRADEELSTIKKRTDNVAALQAEKIELMQDSDLHPARLARVNRDLARMQSGEDVFSDTGSNLVIGKEINTKKKKKEFFSHLDDSSGEWYDTLTTTYDQSGLKGVSTSKVTEAAWKNFSEYSGSAAGRQEADDYNMAVENERIDPKETTESEYIFESFLNTAEEFVHTNPMSGGSGGGMSTVESAEAAATLAIIHEVEGTKVNGSSMGSFHDVHGAQDQDANRINDLRDDVANTQTTLESLKDRRDGIFGEEQDVLSENLHNISVRPHGEKIVANYNQGAGMDESFNPFAGLSQKEVEEYQASYGPEIKNIEGSLSVSNGALERYEIRMATAVDMAVKTIGTDRGEDDHSVLSKDLGGNSHSQVLETYYAARPGISRAAEMDITEMIDEMADIDELINNPEVQALYPNLTELSINDNGNITYLNTDPMTQNYRSGKHEDELTSNTGRFTRAVLSHADKALASNSITSAEHTELVKEIEEFRIVGYAYEAKKQIDYQIEDARTNLDNPIRNNFDGLKPRTAHSNAIARPVENTYRAYTASGKVDGDKVTNPELALENIFRDSQTGFEIRDEAGQMMDGNLYDYENAVLIYTDDVNPSLTSNNMSFGMTVTRKVSELSKTDVDMLVLQGDNDFRYSSDGTINMDSVTDDDLQHLKLQLRKEAVKINVTINDGQLNETMNTAYIERDRSRYYQSPKSQQGQDSYIRYLTRTDPVYASELKAANLQSVDSTAVINRTMYDVKDGEQIKLVPVSYKVTKLPGTGLDSGYFHISQVADDGEVLFEGTHPLKDIGKVDNFIKNIEANQAQQKAEGLLQEGFWYYKAADGTVTTQKDKREE